MKKLYQTGAAVMAAAVLFTGAYQYSSHKLQSELANQILRFHVIANSDTKADQELKLKVRDEIGAYLGKELADVGDLEECEQAVSARLAQI